MINQLLEMVLIAFTKDKLKSKWQTHNNPQPAQYLTRMAIITRADSRRASVRSKPCSRGSLLPLFTSTLKAIIVYSSPCLNLWVQKLMSSGKPLPFPIISVYSFIDFDNSARQCWGAAFPSPVSRFQLQSTLCKKGAFRNGIKCLY